jgi:hypothetical protein
MEKFWIGPVPTHCDVGQEPIKSVFIDGKVGRGPWGFMCLSCHALDGNGLGTGKGQRYDKRSDGRWVKTEG